MQGGVEMRDGPPGRGRACPGAQPTRAAAGSATCRRSSARGARDHRGRRSPGSRRRERALGKRRRRAEPEHAVAARRPSRRAPARRTARTGTRGRASSAGRPAARSRSVTAAARSCSPASQSWPATKPPVQGSPVSAASSATERREALPAAVLARDVRERRVLDAERAVRRARASARARRTARPREQPVSPDDADVAPRRRALVAAGPPQLALHADRARTGRHSCGDLDHLRPSMVSAPTWAVVPARVPEPEAGLRASNTAVPTSRAIAQPPSTTCEEDERERDPEGHRAARRRTRRSPTRRVTPSASKRSSRSCAGRRPDAEQVAEPGEGDRRRRSCTPRRAAPAPARSGGADRVAAAEPDSRPSCSSARASPRRRP